MPVPPDQLDAETLRSLFLGYMRKVRDDTQWVTVQRQVAIHAVQVGVVDSRWGGQDLPNDVSDRLLDVVWGLIVEGVVVPGTRHGNDGWPFLRLTEYERKVIDTSVPAPHDPDGYMARLRQNAPSLFDDPRAVLYLSEALSAYRAGNYISATVMIGIVVELSIERLGVALLRWLPPAQAKGLETTNSWRASQYFEKVDAKLRTFRKDLPQDLRNDLDLHLNGIATILRNHRNDAGHPSGREFQRGEVFSFFQMLPEYLKRVHAIALWIESQPQASADAVDT